MNRYYLVMDGRRKGPFALDELEAQGLERDSLVWCLGLADWSPADQVPALHDLVATLPPPVPAHSPQAMQSPSAKPKQTIASGRTRRPPWIGLPVGGPTCWLQVLHCP